MSLNIGIIFLLMFPSLIVAEDTVNKADISVTRQVFLVIGLILASALTTFSLMVFIYFTLKFIKRKISEPHYYFDDFSSNKDGGEYNGGINDMYAHVPHINQIQPSLNIPHIISSIRQCLADLRDSVIPLSWSHAQPISNPQQPVKEKMDLPI